MAEHQISTQDAQTNLLACATYLAENIKSSDGHAEAMKEIIPRYLEKGEVDLAAGLADTIDDPFVRDKMLTFVAEKCAAIDDDEYALQLVEAIEDYGTQREAMERIALQKSAKNDFAKALEIANELEHPDNALADIALHQAAQGDEAEAQKTIGGIDYPTAKAVALQNIALLNLQKGESEKTTEYLEKAVQAAKEIEYAEEQIRTFLDIGNHFIEAKQNGKAIETFDKAKAITETLDNVHRDMFFSSVALGFLRAGSVDLADRAFDSVTDKTQMISTLVGFSQTFFGKGETGEAKETLEEAYAILKSQKDLEIRDSRARFNLWATIAVLFARYEKPERAVEIAQGITNGDAQMSALSQIAQILTAQGKDDLAREVIQSIGDDAQKIFALIGVADAKNKLEKKDEAIEYLNEAAHSAESVSQLSLRSTILGELAERFQALGENERAREIATENLETIAQIRDESIRAVALANLSEFNERANFDLTDAEKGILQSLVRKAEW